jgi:hypothetical protein
VTVVTCVGQLRADSVVMVRVTVVAYVECSPKTSRVCVIVLVTGVEAGQRVPWGSAVEIAL